MPALYISLVSFVCTDNAAVQVYRKKGRVMGVTAHVFENGSLFAKKLLDRAHWLTVIAGETAQLGVVSPEYDGVCSGSFKTLLLPGSFTKCTADAQCAVTYGMSAQDTITLSSVGTDRCVLAIQREVRDIFGLKTEPQELLVQRSGLSPNEIMAIFGAMLLSGAGMDDFD